MKALLRLKNKAEALKNEITAITFALKDKRTPVLAKILIIITISYALSPVDLIPDFVPVLGYVDDLLLLPGLVALAIKLIPREVLEDSRKMAKNSYAINKKIGWFSAILIIAFWAWLIVLIILKLI